MNSDLDDELGSNLSPKNLKGRPAVATVEPRKRVKIILEEHEDIPPTGLFVGHNGRGYMLRTGVEIDAPVELIEILDNAVKSAPVIDPQSRRVVGHRDQRRFPYRRV